MFALSIGLRTSRGSVRTARPNCRENVVGRGERTVVCGAVRVIEGVMLRTGHAGVAREIAGRIELQRVDVLAGIAQRTEEGEMVSGLSIYIALVLLCS